MATFNYNFNRGTFTENLSRKVIMKILYNSLLICIMSSSQIQPHSNNNYPIKCPDELAKKIIRIFP